jgi:hypothetical protein
MGPLGGKQLASQRLMFMSGAAEKAEKTLGR